VACQGDSRPRGGGVGQPGLAEEAASIEAGLGIR
jgi:hypothetical protein